jgi:hypothetical protein
MQKPARPYLRFVILGLLFLILLCVLAFFFLGAGAPSFDETTVVPSNTDVPATTTASSTPPATATRTSLPTDTPTEMSDAGDEPTELPPTNTLPVVLTVGVNSLLTAEFHETATAAEAVPEDEETDVPATESDTGEAQNVDEPIIIADARLQIRDNVSGGIFGDGTISLYAPDVVTQNQTVRIELELNMANLYITPTPAGALTVFPAPTRITATPRAFNSLGTPLPTPTERFPIHEESGIQFYRRMGASLYCPPDSFSGCNGEPQLSQAKIVTTTVTLYSWLLNQRVDVSGIQDMRLELWIPETNLDGSVEFVTQWEHPFTIEIVSESAAPTLPLWVVAGGFVIIVIIAGGIGLFMTRRKPQSKRFDPLNTTKPKVFISYRRQPSWSLARSVAKFLEKRGADVFLDVDDINEGRFAEMIQEAVEQCDYFVPILAPTTLESTWVRREIEAAIQLNKTIVPLTTDNFDFYAANLPDNLRELSSHNAITVTPEYFDEALERLATRFLKLGEEK